MLFTIYILVLVAVLLLQIFLKNIRLRVVFTLALTVLMTGVTFYIGHAFGESSVRDTIGREVIETLGDFRKESLLNKDNTLEKKFDELTDSVIKIIHPMSKLSSIQTSSNTPSENK